MVDDENKKTGPLGDLFNGLLTPLLTFLTFCGLLVTIIVQQNQLKATLAELKANRTEAAEGNIVLGNQLKNSAAQKFDSNFFSLLQKQDKIVFDINSSRSGGKYFSETIKNIYEGYDVNLKSWEGERDKYLMFFLVNYQILDYVEASVEAGVIGGDDARRYRNIVRAVTPNEFLMLLLINCRGDNFPEYKAYLVNAKFFEHFSYENLKLKWMILLFGTWSVESFGNKDRVRKYLVERTWDVKGHIPKIPREIENDFYHLKDLLNGKDHGYDLLEPYKASHEKTFEYMKNTFDSLFDITSIVANDDIFFAYVRQDVYYFLSLFGKDSKILEDFHQIVIQALEKFSR
ncbi:putative phage abortive infection protein [Delftia sp. WSY_7]|uniref:putative phage abortive infection protein n=1 Tax=Delftia sp. WSY_7 TaxID=3367202 RepID=UPI00370C1D0F